MVCRHKYIIQLSFPCQLWVGVIDVVKDKQEDWPL